MSLFLLNVTITYLWIWISNFHSNLRYSRISKKNVLLCKYRGVITTKATKAAALVDFWDYKKCHKQLGRFEEKNIFTFPKQKNSLNILFFFAGLKWLSFYQEKNLLKHTGSSLQNWRKKYFHFSDSIKKTFWISWIFFAGFKKWIFYYPTKQKTSLNIVGLLCRIEKNVLLRSLE